MNELNDRLTELEIRSTHQERLIEELNQIITAERRRSDMLERELRRVVQMFATLGPELTPSPDE